MCAPASLLEGQSHCPHLRTASCEQGVDRPCGCDLHVLGEIKFVVGVIVRSTLEKRAKSYGFVARVHLAWFSGDFEVPTWVLLAVPVVEWQDNANRTLRLPQGILIFRWF